MHILDASGHWVAGLLDQVVEPGTVRVHVQRQIALYRADQQFFVRPRDIRMVLAYVRAFGPRRVLRKVRSRQSEAGRNDAWLSVGSGWTGDGASRRSLLFVATSGPRGTERWVLSHQLVREAPDVEASDSGPSVHLVIDRPAGLVPLLGADATAELAELAGWQPEEGTEAHISDDTWSAVARALSRAHEAAASGQRAPERPSASTVRERTPSTEVPSDRPPYHVFGYGQYAKVNVITNLDRHLHLVGIHEINPVQLGPVPLEPGPAWDTSRWPRPGEPVVNAVVAGYHHTHVPAAVALLDQGARHVIIEKPVASNEQQVDDLLAAMARHPEARVHCAFQRRHSPFNAMLREDLGAVPVSMAATVYEVPLPPRHWYRWPVVGNAVISNGCHWIDYFLHVNDRPEVTDLGAVALSDQTLLTIELASGASASISLRHHGAPRLGVRDLIQFWSSDGTVTIEDNAHYRAERGFRRLRSQSVHRSRAIEAMYEDFGRRISSDLPGDDADAIGRSARTAVQLAALVDEARAARSHVGSR